MNSRGKPRSLSDLIAGKPAWSTTDIDPTSTGSIRVATDEGFYNIPAMSEQFIPAHTDVVITTLVDKTFTDKYTHVQRTTRYALVSVSQEDMY